MAQQIYCIRHGESQFNEWRTRSLWTFSWIYTRDPMILDPRLSKKGEQQVTELYETLEERKLHELIEVIVVSPLSRAIQTAAGGFRDKTTPMIVNASCREMLDTSSDIGRSAEDLAKDYSSLNLDVSALEEHWWVPQHLRGDNEVVKEPTTYEQVIVLKESKTQLDARIQDFIRTLAAMPHQHIAVVGHSYFFKRMLRMSRKLANCEVAAVSLQDIATLNGVVIPDTEKLPEVLTSSNSPTTNNVNA